MVGPALFNMLWLMLVLLAEAQDIHYVRTIDSPPSDCLHQPCFTLHQYTQTSNFTSGTTLQFLPGNHTLRESRLTLVSVSNITLRGEGSVYIISTNGFIYFERVKGLHVEGLTFLLNYTGDINSALIRVNFCIDVFIFNASFQETNLAPDSKIYVIMARAVYLRHSVATIKNCVFDRIEGGVIYIDKETNLTVCMSYFTNNKGRYHTGAIHANTNTTLLLDGSSTPNHFAFNSGENNGGAIQCYHCKLEMRGVNIFQNNFLSYKENNETKGGALYVTNHGNVTVHGNVSFFNNSASTGGAIFVNGSRVSIEGEIVFEGNVATSYGGGIRAFQTHFDVPGHLNFVNNSAQKGAAFHVTSRVPVRPELLFPDGPLIWPPLIWPRIIIKSKLRLSASFMNNRGMGSVELDHTSVVFTDISITGNSNVGLVVANSDIIFRGTTVIAGNAGGGIRAESSNIVFENETLLDSNSSPNGGALTCQDGNISFTGTSLFVHNTADYNGGAIYAVGTFIHMQGRVNFTRNTASNGGAMYLDSGASLTLKTYRPQIQETCIYFSHNLALKYGGGIYHVDSPTIPQCYRYQSSFKLPHCFLKGEPYAFSSYSSVVHSQNDSSKVDGGFLFGGLLDRCTNSLLDRLLNVNSGEDAGSKVSSKPYYMCICKDNETKSIKYHCKTDQNKQVYRGQKFTVPLLAIGQVGATSTTVTAITSLRAGLKVSQTSQQLPDYCHPITYNLYSTESHEELVLYPDGPCRDNGDARVVIDVTLLPCPDGFTQSGELCTCEERLQHYHVNCTIADTPYFTKTADSNFWMSALYTNTSREGLVLAKSCPAEYCKTDAVNITLDNPDVQCDLNRSRLLCGACATNHSLMLGSSQCQVCPNTYLALLLPFAAAGITLVVFLSFLRLTVATGTLNSVIFYANIVQVNRKLFFPANTRNVLTIFLAWMNLDLGFQTCFYDGMDAYAQTWLQFAFPLYVWLLIALMIVVTRYSITLSKLIGHNPIAVLATLLLMSYTKILKIIIEVYSSAELDYPDNDTVTVWLKDANVPYLQSKHLFLTVVTSLVLVFFFLPYTLLLLLGHKLYIFTGSKHCYWLNRLKPLLDSYHAPYKIHTRYWTGFHLLVRCALYIVFMLNSLSSGNRCLAIIFTLTCLQVIMGVIYSGKIYKKLYVNILEAVIYSNLIVISAIISTGPNTPSLVYTLVALVFVAMALISAYQFHVLYIAKSALWQRLEREWSHCRDKNDSELNGEPDTAITSHKSVTKTTIELREPLLEN